MSTTLDIEDDVLLAAKEIAHQRSISTGKALSELARQALTQPKQFTTRNRWPLAPIQPNARVATLELVTRLRDDPF